MNKQEEPRLTEEDALMLTEKGEKELRGSQTTLTPSELAHLVLVDGQASVGELLRRVRAVPGAEALRIFTRMLEAGLVRRPEKSEIDAVSFDLDFTAMARPLFAGETRESGAEADHGASSLKQSGYFVRIARRAAGKPALPNDRKPVVIVVEDEPSLSKLLRQFLVFEGFDARVASNREEILAEFRRPPLPDLVLLDVVLPDADGFDVLHKIRQHPALKAVPVIMLTAQATRESVLRGLAGGADGYVTKPFEVDVLIKAVRSVLGLPAA